MSELSEALKAACKPYKIYVAGDGHNSSYRFSQDEVYENVKRVLIKFDAVDANDLYEEADDED